MAIATVSPPDLPAPVTPFFPAGYDASGPDFYGWWYLQAQFFQQKSVLRVRQTITANTIANDGLPHTVQFDTVDEDPWQGWSSGSWSWTPKVSGQYQITLTTWTAGLSTGAMLVPAPGGTYGPRGAVASPAGSGRNAGAEGTWTVYLAAGQATVTGTATLLNASASVSTSIVAGQLSSMDIVWLSN